MYEYACKFSLTVLREYISSPHSNPYEVDDINLILENPEIWEFIEFDSDFYFDDPRFKVLEDGTYLVYTRGKAEFESDKDWESGIEEGHFLLGIDYLKITKVEDIT